MLALPLLLALPSVLGQSATPLNSLTLAGDGSGAGAASPTTSFAMATGVNEPSKASTAKAAATTEPLAGESPLEHTRINNPDSWGWWVVGTLNQIDWTFVEPDVDAEEVTFDIYLDNLDKTLCPTPVKVNDEVVHAHWGSYGVVSELKGAKPGDGYLHYLQDTKNKSRIYAESEGNFELRPQGAPVTSGGGSAVAATNTGSGGAAAPSKPAGSGALAVVPAAWLAAFSLIAALV